MKKLLLVLLISMSLYDLKAQDKIITIQKDTIECRIISVNAERISYEQKISENQIIGKSIALPEVLHYYRTEQSENISSNNFQKTFWKKPENHWLFSIQGGLSHSFNKYNDFKNLLVNNGISDSEANDYIRKLKNGYHFNYNFHFLLTNFFGIGAEYSFFHSESDGEFLLRGFDESGHNLPIYNTSTVDEKLFIHFAGASVLFLQHPDKKKKIRISESISPGIIFFRDESRSMEYQIYWGSNDSYTGQPPQYYEFANTVTTSTSFGLKGGLVFEYCFSPKFSAGLTGNIVYSKLNKISFNTSTYDTDNQKLDNKIDITRIDYGISVRYNL